MSRNRLLIAGGICVLFFLSFCFSLGQTRQSPSSSKRKPIATWLVLDQEKGMERIRENADLLASLSVFGEPPREFIDQCHALGIEVYKGVSGNASAFDQPARAEATVKQYLDACRLQGYDGIDLDFENFDQAFQDQYSSFLRKVSSAIHQVKKKLSHCVGFYPGMEKNPPRKIFYDPKVVGETCDLIRVMCYDLYYAPGRGEPQMLDRPDTQGIGPTSNFPWARQAMAFWLKQVPREKLIMGLPAYSNDYDLSSGGKGKQVYAARPELPANAPLQKAWLWYERLQGYLYDDQNGKPHLFYSSDADSTRAMLEIVEEFKLPGFGFWHFSSVDESTWKAVRDWLSKGNWEY
jgi:spore germination protein YaaH